MTIPFAAIEKLESSHGRKRNAGMGALVGAGVGLAVDVVGTEGDDLCSFGACVILPAMGAAAGALVGLAVKTERWQRVPLEKVRVSVLPRRRGLQMALSVTF